MENNNHFLLKITPIYGQENVGSFGDDYIFPPFEEENSGSFGDDYIFPPFREDGSNVEDKDRDGGVS
ncbi:MAG TPA: hypothetical protein VFK40_01230, partial [Nitrososphaeraceae archaeon]|nr:hypothetical protein [Nitrososphaeraceae archaeon]